MNPLLLDIPLQLETERLILRAPHQTGDGKIVNQAIKDSFSELKAWLPFAHELPTAEETEINLRNAHINFLKRESSVFLFLIKTAITSLGQLAFRGLTGPFLNVRLGTG